MRVIRWATVAMVMALVACAGLPTGKPGTGGGAASAGASCPPGPRNITPGSTFEVALLDAGATGPSQIAVTVRREPALAVVPCARLKGSATSNTDARGLAPFWEMAAGNYRLQALGWPERVVVFAQASSGNPRFVLERGATGTASPDPKGSVSFDPAATASADGASTASPDGAASASPQP